MSSSNAAANDESTKEFLLLLGQHERRLRGFILSLVPNWADADDIAQDVRIRLWEQFEGYDRSKDFGVWARAIAYFLVLTHREKQSRLHAHERVSTRFLEAVAEEVAEASKELDAGLLALKDCFDKLPEAKKELLLNYYAGDQTTREIASASGMSFDATRQAILRARITLRDCIEKALHGEDRP